FFHERVADLDIRPLRASIFTEARRRHRRAMNAVAPGFCPDVYDRIADTLRTAIENLVLLENSEREGIDERILRITIRKVDLAADGGNSKAIAVECDSTDNAFKNPFVLLRLQQTETQTVHGSDRSGTHSKDVA